MKLFGTPKYKIFFDCANCHRWSDVAFPKGTPLTEEILKETECPQCGCRKLVKPYWIKG